MGFSHRKWRDFEYRLVEMDIGEKQGEERQAVAEDGEQTSKK